MAVRLYATPKYTKARWEGERTPVCAYCSGYNNVRGGEFKTSRKYNKNPCLLKKNIDKWPIEAVEDQINKIIDELKNHPIIDVYLNYQLEKN